MVTEKANTRRLRPRQTGFLLAPRAGGAASRPAMFRRVLTPPAIEGFTAFGR